MGQLAQVKSIQLALDIGEGEKGTTINTSSWIMANTLWGWLQQRKQNGNTVVNLSWLWPGGEPGCEGRLQTRSSNQVRRQKNIRTTSRGIMLLGLEWLSWIWTEK